MANKVYLNGTFIEQSQATISVLDRGFLFADSVYEVIPVFAARPFRFAQHIQRLERSLSAIYLRLNWSFEQWRELCRELLQQNDCRNGHIYIQITRGAPAQRLHDFPQADSIEPTIYAYCRAVPEQNTNSNKPQKTLSVITEQDIRWKRCDIKSTNLLANCLMKQKALEIGADDTILLNKQYVIEATSSNVFLVKQGVLITPAADEQLLSGITREFVLALARKHEIDIEVREVHHDELYQADEIWLTSSTQEICPVTRVDDVTIAQPSYYHSNISMWWRMNNYYQALKRRLFDGEFGDEIKL